MQATPRGLRVLRTDGRASWVSTVPLGIISDPWLHGCSKLGDCSTPTSAAPACPPSSTHLFAIIFAAPLFHAANDDTVAVPPSAHSNYTHYRHKYKRDTHNCICNRSRPS